VSIRVELAVWMKSALQVKRNCSDPTCCVSPPLVSCAQVDADGPEVAEDEVEDGTMVLEDETDDEDEISLEDRTVDEEGSLLEDRLADEDGSSLDDEIVDEGRPLEDGTADDEDRSWLDTEVEGTTADERDEETREEESLRVVEDNEVLSHFPNPF
jgi:hypothetical protein